MERKNQSAPFDQDALTLPYPFGYDQTMNGFIRTVEFDAWLKDLRDPIGKARILARVRSAEQGKFGDCAPFGEGVSEMRIHSGPGYRVYYGRTDECMYLLLCAGNKSTQQCDIKQAIALFKKLER